MLWYIERDILLRIHLGGLRSFGYTIPRLEGDEIEGSSYLILSDLVRIYLRDTIRVDVFGSTVHLNVGLNHQEAHYRVPKQVI